jgi:hypothetical protein
MTDRKELQALIAEATVDCHDEDECLAGFHAVLTDDLAVPFETTVLGMPVTVTDVEFSGRCLAAVCCRGELQQLIPLVDLPLPSPPPAGSEWIDAYRMWCG